MCTLPAGNVRLFLHRGENSCNILAVLAFKDIFKNLQLTLVDMDETYFISLLFRFIYFFPKNWFSSYPVLSELAPVSRCFFQAHCSSRKVGKTIVNGTRLAMFSARFKKRAENIANLAPCPGSNLTWVHQLWLSRNLVSMENHYDYEVLMVEAGAKDTVYVLYNFWVLTISVRRLDDFQERECRSHWVELMYHCQWHQVGNVLRSILVPLRMSPTWRHVEVPIWINLTWVHHLWLSRNLVSMETHYDYEVLMVEAGAKDTVYVLYNFWVLTISVRRLDDFQERECRSHWVELMYHCQWHQVGNVFRSIFFFRLRMSPTWRHVEVPIWINWTWVHHLWLSRNLVSMETHYDYEVLMVEAGAKDTVYVLYNFWVLTISVRRLDDFQERECRSHWVELMYHCQWHQVGNVLRSILVPLRMSPTWRHVEVPIWHGYISCG